MIKPRSIYLYIALFIGVAALSTSAIFVKLSAAPAPIVAFYRMLFSTVLILPWLFLHKHSLSEFRSMKRRELYTMILSGVLLGVHFVLWFESLRYTSVASSTVLVTLQPIFAFAGSYFLFGERLRKMAIIGGILSIIGSFIIGIGDFRIGGIALLGDVLALLGAAVITIYFLIGKSVRQVYSLPVYTFIVYLSSSVFLALYCAVLGTSFIGYADQDWLLFLGLAVIPTLFGQTVMNGLIRWMSASTISMSILGEPVGTCILAYLILGDKLTIEQWIGSCVILFGILVYTLSTRTKEAKVSSEIPSQTA